MREVDLELDYCPKCEAEETQDPFPTQSFKFFYMFSVAVKCVNCGTYYVPSPRLGVIVTIVYFLGVWIDEYLAEITADSFFQHNVISFAACDVWTQWSSPSPLRNVASDFRK